MIVLGQGKKKNYDPYGLSTSKNPHPRCTPTPNKALHPSRPAFSVIGARRQYLPEYHQKSTLVGRTLWAVCIQHTGEVNQFAEKNACPLVFFSLRLWGGAARLRAMLDFFLFCFMLTGVISLSLVLRLEFFR